MWEVGPRPQLPNPLGFVSIYAFTYLERFHGSWWCGKVFFFWGGINTTYITTRKLPYTYGRLHRRTSFPLLKGCFTYGFQWKLTITARRLIIWRSYTSLISYFTLSMSWISTLTPHNYLMHALILLACNLLLLSYVFRSQPAELLFILYVLGKLDIYIMKV